MDDIASAKIRSAKDEIKTLARKHNVVYQTMPLDGFAEDITRLSGDDVHLDDTELLLLALERTGHLSTQEANRLHVSYLGQ